MTKYSLSTLIYRVLPIRLGIAAVVVAALFSALALYREYNRVGEEVAEFAFNQIEWLRADVRAQQKSGEQDLAVALQRALDRDPQDRLVRRRHGRFAYVRVYGPDGVELAARHNATLLDPSDIDRYIASRKPEFPALDEQRLRRARLAGKEMLHLVLPVSDLQGHPVLWAEGLFVLSDATLAAMHRRAWMTAGYVILLVAGTAVLLYPVFGLLMRRLSRFSEELLHANLATLQTLGSAIAKRDSDTDAHNFRVTLYAARLAEDLALGPDAMRSILKGGFLHDVGKIGIRDAILLKPGRLDRQEYEMMKQHVNYGLEIVSPCSWLADAGSIVGAHHEKFDGSGYPKGLTGKEIPLEARIFAIVDVFDALTSRRPYKDSLTLEETTSILQQGRGTHFDPELLDRFIRLAESLHPRYAGREDPGLREELGRLVLRYFDPAEAQLV